MSLVSFKGGRRSTPPRDPARDRLAFAIAAVAEAERAAAATRTAVIRATDMLEAAEIALADATTAVEAAKAAHTARMVAAAGSGERMAPDASLRNARAAETAARDERDAAREALASVQAAVDGPERQEAWARDRLREAANGVLLTRANEMLDQAQAAQRDFVRRTHAVTALARMTLNTPGADDFQRAADNFAALNFRVPGMQSQADHELAAAPWRAALDRLLVDPDAPLPEVQ